MELYTGCFVHVFVLIHISSVLAAGQVRILQQDSVPHNMVWREERRISSKTNNVPDVSDDEDTMVTGSGMESSDENGETKPPPCCTLGKIAGKTGSPCRMTSHSHDVRFIRWTYGRFLRPRRQTRRQLSELIHTCTPNRELEFYKCCFATKRERFQHNQWLRSRRVVHELH